MERKSFRNIYTRVHFNPKNDYSIKLEGYSEAVNNGLSEACRKVAQMGDLSGTEHLYLVNLETGTLDYYETSEIEDIVGYGFRMELKKNPLNKYAFVHNHNTHGSLSETDMQTLLGESQIQVMVAVTNDGIKYIAESGICLISLFFDDIYPEEIELLNQKLKNGIISVAERTYLREQTIVDNLLHDYSKAGRLVIQDGRK